MTRRPSTSLAAFVLFAGIAWSLPTQVGSDTAGFAAATIPVATAFEVTARRGTVTIAGHTASRRHEAALRDAASRSYPDRELRFEFRPLGLVPDWWVDATTELVTALAPAVAPSARLGEDVLLVDALTRDALSLESGLGAVEALLPESVALRTRLTSAGPEVAQRVLCAKQFDAFRAGAIHFEESGTSLRASAVPELDRIVDLADACRDAYVTITGHTDASGSETLNRQLSLDRARTVAAYLAERGIDSDHLVPAGAGSTVPVADNATRYGRSLNRRIEVRFSFED